MGVNNLIKFLSINGIIPTQTTFSEFANKTVAIDMSILIHRIINASKKLSYKGKVTTHIYGVFMKVYEMLISNIKIIAVFDGKPPSIKSVSDNEQKLDDTIISDVKYLLNLMGVTIIQSIGEADTQCAYLFKNKLIDAVYSRDTDMLAFGCDILLLSFSKTNGMKLNLTEIHKKLNITQSQFIDICIVLGNDYFPGIMSIGIVKVLDFVKDKKIMSSLVKNKDFIRAKNYYMLKNIKAKEIPKTPKANYSLLLYHLVNKLGFNRDMTIRRIDKLRSIYPDN